jgi:hypothetical protein
MRRAAGALRAPNGAGAAAGFRATNGVGEAMSVSPGGRRDR